MRQKSSFASQGAGKVASLGKLELLVIQPTPFCNINCRYCYLPHRQVNKRMSKATLTRTFEWIFTYPSLGERLSVVWHAGEPLVLPTSYYEMAYRIIEGLKPDTILVDHCIQTNGMLLNEPWIEFIKTHKVKVGVSIDGPRTLHDANRKTRAGRGTFDATLRGIHLLRRHRIPFHVITVLTERSLAMADELFDFYVENGICHVGFNIEEIEAENLTSSLQVDGVEQRFRDFLLRFMARMKQNPGALELRELSGALASILDDSCEHTGNPQAEPFRIINVDVDGNISTFSPELLGVQNRDYGDFNFGNVHTHRLEDILRAANLRKAQQAIERGLRECERTCEYFRVCRGGAPANKLFENGSFESTETLYCRLTKQAVIDVVLEDLERDLKPGAQSLSAPHATETDGASQKAQVA
jgi:uncharacterized protein